MYFRSSKCLGILLRIKGFPIRKNTGDFKENEPLLKDNIGIIWILNPGTPNTNRFPNTTYRYDTRLLISVDIMLPDMCPPGDSFMTHRSYYFFFFFFTDVKIPDREVSDITECTD